jgi:4-hydroxy-tetrahydrodipicolinate reductase
MKPARVVVVGAGGRMGRFACGLLEASPEFELVARLGRGTELANALRECGAELALDLTVAGLGAEHARLFLDCGLRPVIGTSGVTRAETAELDRTARARGLGGLVVPNFSLGMAALQRAAEELARLFPECAIVELHHAGKKDAPSGTSLDTRERLLAQGARAPLPIQSVRLPGLYAHQEIHFGGAGETLLLRHDMRSPEAFGPGLLAALRHARAASGVAFGLDAALVHVL